MAAIQITALTHRGQVRPNNEDSILVGNWVRNTSMSKPHQWRFSIENPMTCLVADGMGGHAAGEIASQHVANRIRVSAPKLISLDDIQNSLRKINAEIYDLMDRNPSCAGMGTTVTGIVFSDNQLTWFNVGDSRLYQHMDGQLRQLSIDDVPAPIIDQTSGERRQSHTITQSIGGTKTIQPLYPHIGVVDLMTPSRWLLCTDGLTDMVDIDGMNDCMQSDDLSAVLTLFDFAMAAGGEDNVSILLASITDT